MGAETPPPNKAPGQGNTSPQAAASQPPTPTPPQGLQAAQGGQRGTEGAPRGTACRIHTFRLLELLQQAGQVGGFNPWARKRAQQVRSAKTLPAPQGCTPAPSSPCISLPRGQGKEKQRQSLQQLHVSRSKNRSTWLHRPRRDQFGHSQPRPSTGGHVLAERWEQTASPRAQLCHPCPQKCQEPVPLPGLPAAPQPHWLATLIPVPHSPPAHRSH